MSISKVRQDCLLICFSFLAHLCPIYEDTHITLFTRNPIRTYCFNKRADFHLSIKYINYEYFITVQNFAVVRLFL